MEFQKAKDYKIIGLKIIYYFLDDILIVGKDKKENVKFLCSTVFTELMRKNLGITFPNVTLQNKQAVGFVAIFHNQHFRQSKVKHQ